MFTLHFRSRMVERRYTYDNMSKELSLIRLALFSAAMLYGVFSWLDYYMMPHDYLRIWYIRIVVCALLLVAFASTYGPAYFYRYSQIVLSFCMAICGIGIILMLAIAPSPVNEIYYAGLIMVVIYGAILVRLGFINSAVISLLLICAYQYVSIYVNPIPIHALIPNTFFLMLASMMGLFGGYIQELFVRRNWASTQMIMQGRELLAESQAANHAKSEFLAIVSHELRTPLNAIIGFSEFMKMEMFGPLGSDRYREYAVDIHKSGKHLLQIINDILDLSRAEANKLMLADEKINLQSITDSNLRMFRNLAAAEGIRLKFKSDSMPILKIDERLITQVFTNLLSNAIKFTGRGGEITVSIERGPGGACIMSVRDTGIGIAKENISKILEPFVQVENATSRHHDGLGLGLPLVKRIVDLHHGSLEIRSQLGEGTTVSVMIPKERIIAWETTTPAQEFLAAIR